MNYKHYNFTKYNEILRFIKEQRATGAKSLVRNDAEVYRPAQRILSSKTKHSR